MAGDESKGRNVRLLDQHVVKTFISIYIGNQCSTYTKTSFKISRRRVRRREGGRGYKKNMKTVKKNTKSREINLDGRRKVGEGPSL